MAKAATDSDRATETLSYNIKLMGSASKNSPRAAGSPIIWPSLTDKLLNLPIKLVLPWVKALEMAGTRDVDSASVKMVGTLTKGMAAPEKSPYMARASSCKNPPAWSRGRIKVESTIFTKGTTMLPMVMGRARTNISFITERVVDREL